MALVLALLAGSGYAVAQTPNINLMPDVKSKTPEEKEAEEARDKAYKESLRKIPDAKTSADPWGSMRGGDTAKSVTPAKSRTKTGGPQTRTEAR